MSSSSNVGISALTPVTLTLDYATAQVFNAVKFTGTSSAVNNSKRNPTAWTIEGSSDNITWSAALDSKTGQVLSDDTHKALSAVKTYQFANTTAYQYYRVNLTACGSSSATELGELKFDNIAAPTDVVATKGNTQVSVAFTAPAINSFSVVTGYTVTTGAITQSGIASPIVVTGLTNGTAYTFTVTPTITQTDLTGTSGNTGTTAVYIQVAATGVSAVSNEVTPDIPASLNNVELSNASIIRTDAGINVQLSGASSIELYGANGSLIEKTKTTGTYSRSLNNGMYIICINGKASKFVK